MPRRSDRALVNPEAPNTGFEIDKCPLFELLAICWESGQVSRIHNHQGQNCWMGVPIGKLAVQNYDVVTTGGPARAAGGSSPPRTA